MRKLKDIFNTPALFLHELSHIIVAYVLGGSLRGVDIKRHDRGHLCVMLNIENLTDRKAKFVAMSPFLVPLTFAVLVVMNPIFLIYFPYALMNLETTMPSNTDWKILDL